MRTSIFIFLTFLFALNLLNSQVPKIGTEFSVEIGSDSVFALAGAFDSEKYLVIMRKELPTGGAQIIGQFLSKVDNSLIGSPILFGITNIPDTALEVGIPQVAFDGSRFLVVWTDGEYGGIKYRFIDAKTFQLSNLYSDSTLRCYLSGVSTLHFNSVLNKYFLVFAIKSAGAYYLAGTFIRPDGYMEGSFQISNVPARKEYSLAYGSSKYLVCFIKETGDYDNEVWGQIISESGYQIGGAFLIDGSSEPSDNPLFVTFDGAKFICFFPDEEITGWKIYARFVSPDGVTQSGRNLITSNAHILPYAVVNNDEILFTCTGFEFSGNHLTSKVIGRFFDLSLSPKSDEFVVFDTLGIKNPVSCFAVYADGKYLAFTTRFRLSFRGDQLYLTDGDVYGVTISPITKVESVSRSPLEFKLYQNYPNPFNPTTTIRFSLPQREHVTLKVFDILGREVATLVNEELNSGEYSVVFEAKGLPSGVYFVRLQAGKFIQQNKMEMIK